MKDKRQPMNEAEPVFLANTHVADYHDQIRETLAGLGDMESPLQALEAPADLISEPADDVLLQVQPLAIQTILEASQDEADDKQGVTFLVVLTDMLLYDSELGHMRFHKTTGTGQIYPFGRLYTNLRNTLRMIPGKFSATSSILTDWLTYDMATGEAQFSTTDGFGNIETLGLPFSVQRKPWQIIPGKFSPNSSLTDLLFYDPAGGQAQFATTNGTGQLKVMGPVHNGWRKTWQIIPGKFSPNSSLTDLLFYDPATGEAQFYTTNGTGQIIPLGAINTGWRKTWQIIPGKFSATSSTLTDLLFYDPVRSEAQFYTTNGVGQIKTLGGLYTGWRKTWQIIPGKFSATSSTLTDLLFYDVASGQAQFYTIEGTGQIIPLGAINTGWRKTLQFMPGRFST